MEHGRRAARRRHQVWFVAVAVALGGAFAVGAGAARPGLAGAVGDPACTHTFTGGGDGTRWQDAANWSPAAVPGNGTTGGSRGACIGAAFHVAINAGEEQDLRAVVIDGTLDINEGGKL